MSEDKMKLVMYAWGGVSGNSKTYSMSGGYLLQKVVANEAEEGAVIIVAPDEGGPKTKEWIRKTLSGPMVNVNLKDYEVNKFDTSYLNGIVAQTIKEDVGNPYSDLIKISESQKNEQYNSFDEVGVGIYADLAREAGALIGVKKNNTIEWEDGRVTILPKEGQEIDTKELLHEMWDLIPYKK